MKKTAISVMFIVAIAFMPFSCGTRKVDKNKQSSLDESIESVKSTENESKTESKVEINRDLESSLNINKSQQFKITELFRENGSLESRIKELINKSDSTSFNKEAVKEKYFNTVYTVTREKIVYRTRTINTHSDIYHSDRKGGSLLSNMGSMILLAVFSFLIGKYFDIFKFLKK